MKAIAVCGHAMRVVRLPLEDRLDLGIRGKAALVTGGSRGIGREIALKLAAEGANVGICARDRTHLDVTAAEIRGLGVECHSVVADLTDPASCDRVVDEVASAFGRLDILVNNASDNVTGVPDELERVTDEQLQARLQGKLLPSIRCSRTALKYMRRIGGGRIICIGGNAARTTLSGPNRPSLVAGLGNASLANFAKHLSNEMAKDRVLVNVVHPGMVKTDRFPKLVRTRAAKRGLTVAEAEAELTAGVPIGRVVEPADVAALVVFLSSSLAGAITGQAIAVDGGANPQVIY